jgi:hypothetical protein
MNHPAENKLAGLYPAMMMESKTAGLRSTPAVA